MQESCLDPHVSHPPGVWGGAPASRSVPPNTGLASDILIHGLKARNRAIHGDVVVAELLPQGEWKGRTGALCDNDSEDKASGEAPSEPMPTGEPPSSHSLAGGHPAGSHLVLFRLSTGRVVGILQKNWRDYVVTFPSKEEVQSQGRNAQKILVTPWDYRIPKIRISTQQAEALQVADAESLPSMLLPFQLRHLLRYREARRILLHKRKSIIDGFWRSKILFFKNSKYIRTVY